MIFLVASTVTYAELEKFFYQLVMSAARECKFKPVESEEEYKLLAKFLAKFHEGVLSGDLDKFVNPEFFSHKIVYNDGLDIWLLTLEEFKEDRWGAKAVFLGTKRWLLRNGKELVWNYKTALLSILRGEQIFKFECRFVGKSEIMGDVFFEERKRAFFWLDLKLQCDRVSLPLGLEIERLSRGVYRIKYVSIGL